MLISFSFSNPNVTNDINTNNDLCFEDKIFDTQSYTIWNTKNYIKINKRKRKAKLRSARPASTLFTSEWKGTPKFISNSLQDSIYNYMKETLMVPEVALALAVHESGNFTSNLWLKGNNCFGLAFNEKLSPDFKVWSVGDNHYKCGWTDWRKCIDAFAAWEKRKIKADNAESYFRELRRIGYASDKNHGAKVKAHMLRLFN